MRTRDRAIVAVLIGVGLLCFAFAIVGPLLWPDLGATTTTVKVTYPGCGGDR